MAEDFGVQGRGAFYDETGTIRDVMQNHLFQVLTNLAMEPPVRTDSESIRDEKVKVLKSIAPLDAGRTSSAASSAATCRSRASRRIRKIETFAAVRLELDSWRWQGVPFYIRAGKYLPVTCTEVMVRLRRPPTMFRNCQVARRTTALPHQPRCDDRHRRECHGCVDQRPNGESGRDGGEPSAQAHDEMDAYERVLGDAMEGDATLFAREDYVEEAWRIVDPVLQLDCRSTSMSLVVGVRPKPRNSHHRMAGAIRWWPNCRRPHDQRRSRSSRHQHDPHTVDRCGAAGQFRPSRHADGAGAAGLHDLEPGHAFRSRRIRSGRTAIASCFPTATPRCCCGRCCI